MVKYGGTYYCMVEPGMTHLLWSYTQQCTKVSVGIAACSGTHENSAERVMQAFQRTPNCERLRRMLCHCTPLGQRGVTCMVNDVQIQRVQSAPSEELSR